ncbi:hypothetical protein HMPREF0201_02265 [Cedecea davisae DSM 4568]|uniref:Uncharacterized protein n=1 Tax=Cedecea davisae DSM 4568 TaxID=566551 RepID=S3IVN4_9ENTR|nr:hypothetical protein HMPREF0201_02265 [Cedecea davisae DSM 4568]
MNDKPLQIVNNPEDIGSATFFFTAIAPPKFGRYRHLTEDLLTKKYSA